MVFDCVTEDPPPLSPLPSVFLSALLADELPTIYIAPLSTDAKQDSRTRRG